MIYQSVLAIILLPKGAILLLVSYISCPQTKSHKAPAAIKETDI